MFDRDGPFDRQDLDVKDRADRALRAGKAVEALPLYASLLRKVSVLAGGAYEAWLEGALAAYQMLGRQREAGTILLHLRRFGDAERCFDPRKSPFEWAVCVASQGRPREAARTLSAAGFGAMAALALEASGDWAGARDAWSALLADDRLRGRPYETALVHFNLGHVLRRSGDGEGARRTLVLAQQLLEELADTFESEADTERAFACYVMLLRLGRDGGAFENVAEGYVNAIRVLAQGDYEHLTALQYYEDFLDVAAAGHEWHAAAMLAEEAADFCLRLGLAYARQYRHRAATLWGEAARHNAAQGGPPEMSENALVAAVDAAAASDDMPLVGQLYALLAELPLVTARRERYAALARRYRAGGESPPAGPGFPEHFRVRRAYPEVWRQDIVEWELGGRPVPVLVQLLAEGLDHPPSEREALRALLLCAEDRFSLADPVTASELASALGRVRAYEVLRVLEELAEHTVPRVRSSAMAAAGKCPHKRSFRVVRRGLADADESVRLEARRALRGLGFRSGLSSLVRLYREARDELLRHTLVEAIADIEAVEAGLFLVDLVRYETGPLQELAGKRLRRFRCADLWPVVRRVAEGERGPVRRALEEVLVAAAAT